jgi:hypothetical protein
MQLDAEMWLGFFTINTFTWLFSQLKTATNGDYVINTFNVEIYRDN